MTRNRFNVALSGLTAFMLATWIGQHEGPLACHMTPAQCRPDELPFIAFLVIWGALYLVADHLTPRGRK